MKTLLTLFLWSLFSITNLCSGQEISLLSWNIQHFGQSKDDIEMQQIANLVNNFDLVAIQEVVAKTGGAPAVARLVDILNRKGSRWDYRISDPTSNESPYKRERYAFLWKTHRLKIVGRPFLDQKHESSISREPFVGRFLAEDQQFIILNYHSIPHDQHPEQEVVLFPSIVQQYASTPIIIAGDFNMNEENASLNGLKAIGYQPAIKNQPTSLRQKCSTARNKHPYLAHAIDNIYTSSSDIKILKSGVLDFVGQCDNLKTARQLSDHLAVGIQFIIIN